MKIKNYYSELVEKFKSNIFFQNIALVASGNIGAKLIGILSAPVITRIYSPEDYGIFAIFTSFVGILGTFSTLRYHITIPIAQNEKLADNLLKLSFLISFSLSLLLGLIIIMGGDFLTKQFGFTQIKPYLWILPLAFLGQGMYHSLSNWTVRKKYFRVITRTKITQSISSSTIKIFLGLLGFRPLGLLLGIIALESAGIISILKKFLKEKVVFFKTLPLSEIKSAAIRYKKFPLFQTWSHLLQNLALQLPVIFVAYFYGAKVAGIFGLAHNIVNMPLTLIVRSVSEVFYSEIANYGISNPKKIFQLTISIIKKMAFLSILPLSFIILFGPSFFSVIFGSEWYEAGIFARFLSIMIFTKIIASPSINILNVLEKQGIQLTLNLLRAILTVFSFLLCYLLDYSATITIIVYSITIATYYIFLLFITIKNLKKEFMINQ